MNTGRKIYTQLKEVSSFTREETGRTKPNVLSDPDYIAPVNDTLSCPIGTTPTTTTTTTIFSKRITANITREEVCPPSLCIDSSYHIAIIYINSTSLQIGTKCFLDEQQSSPLLLETFIKESGRDEVFSIEGGVVQSLHLNCSL